MKRDKPSEPENRQHRRRFTEGLLNVGVILKALNIQPGQTVLDAGCGNGYMAKVFSGAVSQSGKVVALDPDTYFIEILKDETKGTNIEAIEGDTTTRTGLKGSSVDLVYLSTVLHGFSKEQIQGFNREARRLLRPGAKLAIVEIEKKETPFGPPVESRFSPEDLKEIIPLVPVETVRVGEHFYMEVFQNKP
jgi:ubiquinone/menaquinone biosynthesis C-methylase UbiE